MGCYGRGMSSRAHNYIDKKRPDDRNTAEHNTFPDNTRQWQRQTKHVFLHSQHGLRLQHGVATRNMFFHIGTCRRLATSLPNCGKTAPTISRDKYNAGVDRMIAHETSYTLGLALAFVRKHLIEEVKTQVDVACRCIDGIISTRRAWGWT